MTLRSKQRKALEVITAGGTVAQAAASAGVTETTIYNWKTEDAFKQALQDANSRILSDTVTALTVASVRAVEILIEVAEDTEAPPGTRVSAARAILDSTIKVRELYDLEQRIADIESRVAS